MNVLPQSKIDALFDCFRVSLGVRAAAREVGVARHTAQHYLRQFEAGESRCVLCLCGKPRHRGWCAAQEIAQRTEAKCGCGKPLRHRGWCSIRIARSPSRQALIAGWHAKRRQPQPKTEIAAATTQAAISPPAPAAPRPLPVVHAHAPSLTDAQRKAAAISRAAVQRRARRMKVKPTSREELQALIAASGVTVKRYAPGAHRGWVPSWME